MMNKILVLGIVAVLVIGGLWFLWPEGDGDEDMNGTATICVQEVGKAETYEAVFDLGDPSSSELMMMSLFGQGIRGSDFALQSTPGEPGGDPEPEGLTGVVKLGKYRVWAKATVQISGTDIPSATLSASQVKFSATTGAGVACCYTSSPTTANVVIDNALKYGQTVTVDQSTVGKWLYVKSGTTTTSLLGQDLDGMNLNVYITASAVDQNGKTVNAATSATLKLTVSSWAADGTLSAVITSLSSGGLEKITMLEADAHTGIMEAARA